MRTARAWVLVCAACLCVRAARALPPAALGDAVANAATHLNLMKVSGAWQRISNRVSESIALKHTLRRLQDMPVAAARLVHGLVDRMRVGGGPVVKTGLGSLRGRLLKARTAAATPYYSFKGIRYAKPPTGALRFRPPAPLERWRGVRDALEPGAVCPHRSLLLDNYKGDEDCLFLNVYTPVLPDKNSTKQPNLPVMVWIHGGAFAMGSGNAFLYGPDHLVGAGVVLVTLNYRLGALGFLSLDREEVAGNMGLKDQVQALRWVRDNIQFFGGNPASVTIFGESAGAASVHLHMLSRASRGLFHRAIAQSGVAVAPWTLASDPVAKALALGKVLGIDTNNTAELAGYLRATPSETLVKATAKLTAASATSSDFQSTISLPFLPVVERDDKSGTEFLTKHPSALLREGDIADVPFLTGFNAEEGIILFKRLQRQPGLLEMIDSEFARVVPPDLSNDTSAVEQAATKIRHFYFQDRPVDMSSVDSLIDLFTDLMFVRPLLQTLRFHRLAGHSGHRGSSDFLYRFAFDGALGLFKRMLGITHKGTCHGDELGYLFYFGRLNYRLDESSPELSVTRHMVQMWTNFAKNGHPTPKVNNNTTLEYEWLPVKNAEEADYLDITGQYIPSVEPLSRRMRFWKQLYEDFDHNLKES